MNTCDHVFAKANVYPHPGAFARTRCTKCLEMLYFEIVLTDCDAGTMEVLDVNDNLFMWEHPKTFLTEDDYTKRYAELSTIECKQKLTKQIGVLAGKPMSRWRITDDPETSS